MLWELGQRTASAIPQASCQPEPITRYRNGGVAPYSCALNGVTQAARSIVDNEQHKRARKAHLSADERDAEDVRAALAAAGIDPRDFGRFVNRPFPGVIEAA